MSHVPEERIIELTPEQLRAVAGILETPGSDPVPADHLATAAECRTIADRLERGDVYSIIRPPYKVTYRRPSGSPADARA